MIVRIFMRGLPDRVDEAISGFLKDKRLRGVPALFALWLETNPGAAMKHYEEAEEPMVNEESAMAMIVRERGIEGAFTLLDGIESSQQRWNVVRELIDFSDPDSDLDPFEVLAHLPKDIPREGVPDDSGILLL